jgi:hypothetical protein
VSVTIGLTPLLSHLTLQNQATRFVALLPWTVCDGNRSETNARKERMRFSSDQATVHLLYLKLVSTVESADSTGF